jgi:methylated-DNA-[protein]-cysteine S-methyltransferase
MDGMNAIMRRNDTMTYASKTMDSPVGTLTLVASGSGLAAILWQDDDPARVPLGPLVDQPDHSILIETERQLAAYFAGTLRRFDVPLDFSGTDFQKSVWAALLTIPFGETRSYGDIARQIGRPAAVRAVGAANGRNPISIIAPCHRVIGANGSLTGFAGGLKAKETLLALEGGRLL